MIRSVFLSTLGLCLASFLTAQQPASVKGFVYDKSTGEPVPFSNVYLKGTTHGVNTDLNGFFNLTRIPAGEYTLLITNLDFDTIREKLSLKAGDQLSRKFFANKGGISLSEVEVSTVGAEKLEKTSVGIQKIDPVVINKLPSIGEPDIAQYLQVLPGVVFTGDQGGQLYIRGGLPVQNKVLLDGLIVYQPFHSIGLFSVFDSDILKNADVYSAGFGAEYGGRTSSIMDITTRDGNKKRHGGKVALSTFGAKATLEGPLMKLDDAGTTSASYIFSAKHSYLPQTSKILYSYANPNGLPFYYTDIYGKASLSSTGGSKFNLFGFSFNDRVDFNEFQTYDWSNFGVGSNFVMVPEGTNLLIEGVFAYSSYKINFTNPKVETDAKSSSINGVNTGFNFVKFFGRSELRYGFEGITTNTTFDVINPFGANVGVTRQTIDLGMFSKFKYISPKGRLVFEPSFRLQYYATVEGMSPEPRAAFKYNLTKRVRIKGAGGLYSQTLVSANSDRDVVNLFYGFVNAPQQEHYAQNYVDYNSNEQQIKNPVMKATHFVGGVEADLFKHFELNVETYQKNFNQVFNINRDKIFEDNSSNEHRPEEQRKSFIVEQGRTRGFDVVLKYDRKRFYFWAVYSLTFNDRWIGSALTKTVYNYPPVFDRRHNVNLVSSYSLGKKKEWEINARWNYGSGFPFTQTQGFYNQLMPGGSLTYNYANANGILNYIPAELNQGRLPDFHRLDIGVKYRYLVSERSTLEVSLGATNMYNRKNVFQMDRFTFQRVDQLPIMPNLNVSMTF